MKNTFGAGLLVAMFLTASVQGTAVQEAKSIERTAFIDGDQYTEYTLLEPDTHRFRVVHFVTELETGVAYHISRFHPGIPEGDVEAYDPQNGQRLKTEVVNGVVRVHLPRAVELNAERRIRIERTYRDEKSYYTDGDEIVWTRSMDIGRNSIVLPQGYKVVSSNVAAQILPLESGRLRIAFVNWHGWPGNVTIRAQKTPANLTSALSVPERSRNHTETLYDLQAPETHGFNITHDYEEKEIGYRTRLTVLMSEPIDEMVVRDLDTGNPLKVERQGLMAFAVFDNPVVTEKHSARLRVTGKVQDPSYRVEQNELVWDRVFLGLRNTVVLPAGWELTMLTAPASIGTQADGRTYVSIVNPREDQIRVHFRARRTQ